MYNDMASGRRGDFDPKDYYHNQRIKALFDRKRSIAWATIKDHPEARLLTEESEQKRSRKLTKSIITSNLLSIYK